MGIVFEFAVSRVHHLQQFLFRDVALFHTLDGMACQDKWAIEACAVHSLNIPETFTAAAASHKKYKEIAIYQKETPLGRGWCFGSLDFGHCCGDFDVSTIPK